MAVKKSKNFVIPGLLLLCAGLIYFAGQFAAESAMLTPFSKITHTVSELGSTTCTPFTEPLKEVTVRACSPLHPVMNSAFILFGLGLFAGTLFSWKYWPHNTLSALGLILLAIAGLCLVLVGLAPGNMYPVLHGFAANIQFYAQNIGMMLLGLALTIRLKPLGGFTLVSGIIGLSGYLIFMNLEYLTQGYGLWQRVAGYPLGVWAVVAGMWLVVEALVKNTVKHAAKRVRKA